MSVILIKVTRLHPGEPLQVYVLVIVGMVGAEVVFVITEATN